MIIISFVAAVPAHAAEFIVQDPCSEAYWLQSSIDGLGESVGSLTMRVLESHGMDYSGSNHGINSIQGTVTGDQAFEVISDREMRAYGWCFSVNHRVPTELADQVYVEAETDVIRWFFAYAHYKDGDWVSLCVPTHKARPAYICAAE